MATPINILSAGAVSPGLVKVRAAFQRDTGQEVAIAFATAPQLRKLIADGASADIVIAPPEILDDLTHSGKAQGGRVAVGRIGVGVMVRRDVALPKIATVEDLQLSLLNSESIFYNQASSGLYIDNLFKQLGIAPQSEAKITRCGDFAAVRDQIANSRGSAIGFGATTVIVESSDHGVAFAGPLPAEIQNYTSYGAALTVSASGDAAAFMDYLAGKKARSILRAAGID